MVSILKKVYKRSDYNITITIAIGKKEKLLIPPHNEWRNQRKKVLASTSFPLL